METANLHTLDKDILYQLLIESPDLVSLRCLILTHPALYIAFQDRRQLILQAVFKTKFPIRLPFRSRDEGTVVAADEYIHSRNASCSAVDRVAFRVALWLGLRRLNKGSKLCSLSVNWAMALLALYHEAGLEEDALAFARSTITLLLGTSTSKHTEPEHCKLYRATIRTLMTANFPREAMEVEEKVLQRLSPRLPDHTAWAKQLIKTYQRIGCTEKIVPLYLDCWELYRAEKGPGSEIALDWARMTVRNYQLQGQDRDAIKFHREVWKTIPSRSSQWIGWSRQLIQMHLKANESEEALLVKEEVWEEIRHDPGKTGYRAWALELSEQYETLGRPDDAIRLLEDVWRTMASDSDNPSGRYKALGAGLALATIYRRYRRNEEVDILQASMKSKGLNL